MTIVRDARAAVASKMPRMSRPVKRSKKVIWKLNLDILLVLLNPRWNLWKFQLL
jgi:hypothetical protein